MCMFVSFQWHWHGKKNESEPDLAVPCEKMTDRKKKPPRLRR